MRKWQRCYGSTFQCIYQLFPACIFDNQIPETCMWFNTIFLVLLNDATLCRAYPWWTFMFIHYFAQICINKSFFCITNVIFLHTYSWAFHWSLKQKYEQWMGIGSYWSFLWKHCHFQTVLLSKTNYKASFSSDDDHKMIVRVKGWKTIFLSLHPSPKWLGHLPPLSTFACLH